MIFVMRCRQSIACCSALGLLVAAGLGWGGLRAAQAAPSSGHGVAVPAYFDPPGRGWSDLEHDDPPVRLVVMNPDSGPGGSRQSSYVSAVRAAQADGVVVVGYVDTRFAQAPMSEVQAQVDDYYRWYAVNGIFFDDASTACSKEPYYAALNGYVKSEGGVQTTILNPGTATNRCYTAAADILVTFEGSYSQYLRGYSAPAWAAQYPPSRFWQIVYDAPTVGALDRTVALSRERGAGWVYVTRGRLPNPYGALPGARYWSEELAAVADG
jgi:hypothetical protein